MDFNLHKYFINQCYKLMDYKLNNYKLHTLTNLTYNFNILMSNDMRQNLSFMKLSQSNLYVIVSITIMFQESSKHPSKINY